MSNLYLFRNIITGKVLVSPRFNMKVKSIDVGYSIKSNPRTPATIKDTAGSLGSICGLDWIAQYRSK